MLRIWKASGEELAAIPSDELSDVKALKWQLRAQEGIPVCLQQLLHDGSMLADCTELQDVSEVQLVLSCCGHGSQNDSHDELLHAAEFGEVDVVRRLLDAGTPQNVADAAGWTTLHFASDNGQIEVVRLLLQAGVDPDSPDHSGMRALHLASDKGYVEVARLLLEADASTDVTNEVGSTPLHHASANGHVEVVRLLLESGAEKDQHDHYMFTACMLAYDRGQFEVVRLLEASSNHQPKARM